MSGTLTHPLIIALKRDLNHARTFPSNGPAMVRNAIQAVYSRYTPKFGDEIESGRMGLQDAIDCYQECCEYDGLDPVDAFAFFKARDVQGAVNGQRHKEVDPQPIGEAVEAKPRFKVGQWVVEIDPKTGLADQSQRWRVIAFKNHDHVWYLVCAGRESWLEIDLAHHADEQTEPRRPALPTSTTAAAWHGRELQPRRYIAPNFLPFREVSLLNGHGGAGKTQLALQIAIATVLGTDCFGFPIAEKGAVVFYTPEEEQEELQRRCQKILDKLPGNLTLADLPDLHFIATSESDSEYYRMELADFDPKNQNVTPSRALNELMAVCDKVKPVLVVIENATDVFPFSELIREVVNRCLLLLRQIARANNCAVLLLQHVSESSRQTGEFKSGSTGWHNKGRYRFSLSVPVIETEDKIKIEDDAHRLISFHKNQYGARPENIMLDNDAGYFAMPGGFTKTLSKYEREVKDDEIFLTLLDQDAERGLYHSPQPTAPNGIIKTFFGTPEGRPLGKARLKAAMQRLLKAKTIKVALHPGKAPSKASPVVMRDRTAALRVVVDNDEADK